MPPNNNWEGEELTLEFSGIGVFFGDPNELAKYMAIGPQYAEDVFSWIQSAKIRIQRLEQQLRESTNTTASLQQLLLKTANGNNSINNDINSNAPELKQMRARDPPRFSGNREDWFDFKVHMHLKMSLDGHFYPTAAARMLYVISRCTGLALRHIACYFKNDGSVVVPDKPQADWHDLLDKLELAFGDPTTFPPPR